MSNLTQHTSEEPPAGQERSRDGRKFDSSRSEPPPRPSTARRTAPPSVALQARPRPGVVTASFWVWTSATLVAAFAAGVALTQFDRMHAVFVGVARNQAPEANPATLNHVANVSIAVLIGVGALLALLQLALAAAMQAGRGWARFALIALTVLTTLYSVVLLSGVTEKALAGVLAVTRAALLLYVTLTLVASVLMFLAGGRAWFRRRKLNR